MIDSTLDTVDLTVGDVYGVSRNGNPSDDPRAKLPEVDNGASFRHLGERPKGLISDLLALKTSISDINWPETLDCQNGIFVYYGAKRATGNLAS